MGLGSTGLSSNGFTLLCDPSFVGGANLVSGGGCSSLGVIISNWIGVVDSTESRGDGGGVAGMSWLLDRLTSLDRDLSFPLCTIATDMLSDFTRF